MLACGVGVAAAYLTRPEGLEFAVAAGIALLALQFTAIRQAWRRVGLQLAALDLRRARWRRPLCRHHGPSANKNTAKVLVGDPDADPARMLPYGQAAPPAAIERCWRFGCRTSVDWHGPRWLWALKALLQETAQGFSTSGSGSALLGLIVSRTHRERWGGTFLVAGVVALHALILCRMASLSGYLSERHVLMLRAGRLHPRRGGAALARRSVAARRRIRCRLVRLLIVLLRANCRSLPNRCTAIGRGTKPPGDFCASNRDCRRLRSWIHSTGRSFTHSRPCRRRNRPTRSTTSSCSKATTISTRGCPPRRRQAHRRVGEVVYHWPENKPIETAQVKVYRVAASIFAK